ncbi:PREDICTED: centromere protein C [Nipponia nippon]|uniref:centromere protein C n=1 Tax=Nipponia nippon TaxID=128390 RepID=UPI0005118F26|nr:PREDICTED: centromere protein C [Nipponia nippon]
MAPRGSGGSSLPREKSGAGVSALPSRLASVAGTNTCALRACLRGAPFLLGCLRLRQWLLREVCRSRNHFKKDYRARFCHGGGNKIDVQPGQNVLKLIQDCFESCGGDLTISSPSATCCSTPIVRNEKRTSIQSQRAGLTNSVKRACNSPESLPASALNTVSSRGWSHESPLKPAIHDYVADSKTPKSPVSKRETSNILKDVEALCKSPAISLDPEDDHESLGSPLLVEEVKSSPVHILHFDDQNTPAAAKSHVEVENLEGPQTGKDEQVVLMQGTERIATPSVRKEKSFSSAVLAAVATGSLGKRYSASISPPSPPPVKDQDIEIENECEFLIDESDGVSFNSWFSIPHKNKKSKKDGSATPKPQPSEKEKTESKKGKKRKAQVEALTKQKTDDLDVRVPGFKGTSESDPVSNSEGKVLKSQRQNSTPMGKTKRDALRQGSPNQKKETSWKPEAEELMLSQSGLETKASDAEQCKTRVMPNEDSPMLSAGHQQERTVSPKKNLKSSKYLQSASKAAQHLVHKKQTAKQKLPKDTVAKRLAESPRKKLKKSGKKSSNKKPQLQREESSDTEPGEEELEREPVKLEEVFTSPLHQNLQTSMIQKLAKSDKPKNVLRALESLGGANNKTPVKALQHLIDGVKNSGKKQLSAKSSGKIAKKICHRASKGVCSSPEDAESQMDSDSSSVQDMARKNQKLSDMKRKRKRNTQHGLQDSFAAEKATSRESGPVLEHRDKFTSRSKSCEQDNTSSDNSEDFNCQVRNLLSDNIARHNKIVMPSNTPNVRRTKRIRLRPLEYWRGERVNYTMRPSGGLVISGIVCPETEPHRKIKRRKGGHKQKRDETRSEIPANLDHTLADTSKPTVVLDPVTNEEVLLECVNTESSHSCFFKDESVEIYKNLNTSAFASGRLILKPFKEKGHQFVHMDTIAFHVIRGKIIVTLHKTSYYLTTGDFFYVPAGNGYNVRNLLNEESVLLFTQLKKDRPKARSMLLETSSP